MNLALAGRALALAAISIFAPQTAAFAQGGTVYIHIPQSKPSPHKKDTAAELKTLTVRWPEFGGEHKDGYYQAEIDLRYRFIACMGEIHVAYSLDQSSLRTGPDYAFNRTSVAADPGVLPKIPSIAFQARVYRKTEHRFERLGWVSDKFAGPALGYGCFTGQSEKVGLVAEMIGKGASKQQIDSVLNDELYLQEGFVDSEGRLRNAALEVSPEKRAADEKFEREKAAYKRGVAEHQAARERYESDLRAMQEQKERSLAATQQSQAEFAQQRAAYEAELARAQASQQAYREEYKRITGKYPD